MSLSKAVLFFYAYAIGGLVFLFNVDQPPFVDAVFFICTVFMWVALFVFAFLTEDLRK